MDYILLGQLAINGVLLGLVYSLVGLGLSVVLGIMDILNIAHGALYMFGGYLAFAVTQQIGLPAILGVLFAAAGMFVLGLLINIFVVATSNDSTSVMMITFGIAIVINEAVILIWGGYPVAGSFLTTSSLSLGTFYAQDQIWISSLIGIGVAAFTLVFFKKAKVGKAMRMISQNRENASVVGVNIARVSALALGMSSAFAGLAGALLTPLYLVFPDSQWQPLTAAFIIVTIGGLGSIKGSIVGGLIYGILLTVGSYVIPAGSDIFALVLIIVIIVIRPRGLFGVRERI